MTLLVLLCMLQQFTLCRDKMSFVAIKPDSHQTKSEIVLEQGQQQAHAMLPTYFIAVPFILHHSSRAARSFTCWRDKAIVWSSILHHDNDLTQR